VDPATDCPSAGYACRAVTGGNVCWTGCTADAQCPLTGKCDVANGFCVPPELCTNGLDDDFDLHADCSDLDCAGTGACPAATDVEPNDTFATATPFAGPFTGSIGIVDDIDYVSVVVAGPAQTLTVKVHDGGSGDCAAGRLDPTVEIFAPDGTTSLAYADDMATGNWCSRVAATRLAAGTYFVRIDSNPLFAPTDTFIYTLDVSLTP